MKNKKLFVALCVVYSLFVMNLVSAQEEEEPIAFAPGPGQSNGALDVACFYDRNCYDTVSNAGDFNGDGIDDIIVGASSIVGVPGKAYVIFGRSGITDITVKIALCRFYILNDFLNKILW